MFPSVGSNTKKHCETIVLVSLYHGVKVTEISVPFSAMDCSVTALTKMDRRSQEQGPTFTLANQNALTRVSTYLLHDSKDGIIKADFTRLETYRC